MYKICINISSEIGPDLSIQPVAVNLKYLYKS